MKCNVGLVDRMIRLILGAVIILVGALFKSWWGLVGVVIFITGLIGWCGLYVPLKINTCKIKTPEEGTDTVKEEKP